VKRTTVLVFTLAMSLSVLAQTAKAPVGATAAAITAAPVALQSDRGNADVKVWVNTNSGVYHCPGTRWYGATKQGVYMTQAEAQKKGYRPAYGKVCR
jgi:hypothetical protein